jgi:hypothetical protein
LGLFPDWWQPRRRLNIQVLGSAARLRLLNAVRRLMLLFDE